jgi:3D (Asp-Asp-Asp) domain-containing protein
MRGRIGPLLVAALAASAAAGLWLVACAWRGAGPPERSLLVTATAYTSRVEETDASPHVAAWNDRVAPGMRAIAVSPDLLAVGLERGAEVRIEGLRGNWTVLDRMHPRWSRRIDVYMGHDVEAARDWGKRPVRISW